jgi:hypothetical protein
MSVVERAKVLVGLPNYHETMSRQVVMNRMSMIKHWAYAGVETQEATVGRLFIHFARSALVEAAIAGGYTHIFFVDDDALVPTDTLPRFIAHDVDIVGVPYPGRHPPHEICVKIADGCGFWEHDKLRNVTLEELDKGLVKCAAVGTHAMLIKTEVFTAIPPSGHRAPLATGHDDHRSFMQEYKDGDGPLPFAMPRHGTEDMYFCYRALRKGFGVYCDTDTWADHEGLPQTIGKEHVEYAETATTV